MSNATEVITINHEHSDITSKVREAIENVTEKDIKIVFEKGVYTFLPDYALSRHSFITNHGNGYKRVAFRFEGFDSVTIEGNGSEFIFHGRMAPFQFEDCGNIKVSGITIDWDIPLIFQAEVLKVDENNGWFDLRPLKEGYSWKFKDNHISFPDIDGFNFHEFGHTHCFDPKTKSTFHGANGLHLNPNRVEKLSNGTYRFHEKLKHYPPVGCIVAAKGEKELNRYAPAFQTQNCKNVNYDKIIIHHALGMGFLFERTENITISNGGVYTRDGSDRYISSTADATHFANCKGDILIENCRIEGMLDDGTNVHGTYVKVDKVVNENTVIVELHHFEQAGFQFADSGDEVWFVQKPNPNRGEVNTVKSVKFINDTFSKITFKEVIPTTLKKGDILENKTWNPNYTIRGCKISKHRARNLMLKTPLKIVVEGNYFSSDMSAIGFRGETYNWYESGAVQDVVIRNNHFEYCVHGNHDLPVLWISPKLNRSFDRTITYDRNIVFEDNIIETFGDRIVTAEQVDGLIFRNNTIKQTDNAKKIHNSKPMFEFKNCKNVIVSGNRYIGANTQILKTDKASETHLKFKRNKGLKL
ncbi:right-handed parallel beta-helix repeat-containing protein [Flavivirga amylovorans]